MKKKTLVHICPKCGSTDVKSILLFSPLMANTSAFVCKNCDYMRSFVAPDFWKVNSQDFMEVYKEVVEEFDGNNKN